MSGRTVFRLVSGSVFGALVASLVGLYFAGGRDHPVAFIGFVSGAGVAMAAWSRIVSKFIDSHTDDDGNGVVDIVLWPFAVSFTFKAEPRNRREVERGE